MCCVHQPLLLVDIDGVISLFGFDPARPPDGTFRLVGGIPHFLSRTAGLLLVTLSEVFELVWCSGWEEKADEYLPHALGLPGGLPHLTFSSGHRADRHWKLPAVEAHVGPDRPVAWVDDDFDDSCQAWCAARPGPARRCCSPPTRRSASPRTTPLNCDRGRSHTRRTHRGPILGRRTRGVRKPVAVAPVL